jgi:hypothetical protein
MPTLKQKISSQFNILTTELNSMASGARVLSAAFNNVIGGGGTDGYTHLMLHMAPDFASLPTANTGFSVWILRSADGGTTYEDGGTALQPARPYDGFLAINSTIDPQVVSCIVPIPPGHFKVLISNGSGQSLPSSGSTLKGAAYTLDLV